MAAKHAKYDVILSKWWIKHAHAGIKMKTHAEQRAYDLYDQQKHRDAKRSHTMNPNQTLLQPLSTNSMLVPGTNEVLKCYQNHTVYTAPLKH